MNRTTQTSYYNAAHIRNRWANEISAAKSSGQRPCRNHSKRPDLAPTHSVASALARQLRRDPLSGTHPLLRETPMSYLLRGGALGLYMLALGWLYLV